MRRLFTYNPIRRLPESSLHSVNLWALQNLSRFASTNSEVQNTKAKFSKSDYEEYMARLMLFSLLLSPVVLFNINESSDYKLYSGNTSALMDSRKSYYRRFSKATTEELADVLRKYQTATVQELFEKPYTPHRANTAEEKLEAEIAKQFFRAKYEYDKSINGITNSI